MSSTTNYTYKNSRSSAILIDDTTTANITYIGYLQHGSAAVVQSDTSEGIWAIEVVDETNSTGTPIIYTFPDGLFNFDQIWDNRTGLTYELPKF